MASHQQVLASLKAATSSFTPADLTSLILWGEADTQTYTNTAGTTACTTDGDICRNWKDLSGAGSNLVWGTGEDALYKTNLTNSKPGIRFPTSGSALHLESTQANNQKPVSVACVVRATNVTDNNTIFDGTTGGSGLAFDINAGNFRLLKANTALIGSNSTTISNNTFYIVIVTYDSSGNYAYTLNGASDGSGTNNQTFTNTGTRIGTSNIDTARLGGDLLAFVKTSAVMTGTEISNLTSYWNTKYTIY